MNALASHAVLTLLLLCAPGCDRILPQRVDTTLPAIDDVQAIYQRHGIVGEIEYSGNVVDVRVEQPYDQLRRGGRLWARVGPYIYLFSPATRETFDAHAGIAGVRVITLTPDRDEVARALLVRDAMGHTRWRRSLNLLGVALRDGTQRPRELERLVEWGEQHTEFRYNPRWAPTDGGRER